MNKKKLYEKCGAIWFQKIVFKVERLKFKMIDKLCPNIGNWYDKQCDKKANKLCNKTDDEIEKNNIRLKYNYKKMFFKRELAEKKNRNYHMNTNNANSFRKYLNWNKKMHCRGMIKNGISIVGSALVLGLTSGFSSSLAALYLTYNLICLGVNFECVNLQNYNIYRFDEKREILEKIEKRQKESDAKKYHKVGETIYKKLEGKVELPKQEEVISSITNIDELMQLRSLAIEIKNQRTKMVTSNNIKKIGGKK